MTYRLPRALRASALAVALLALAPAAAAADSYTNDIYTVNADGPMFGAVTGSAHPAGPGLNLTYMGNGGYNIVHSYTSGHTYDLTGEQPTVSTLPDGVRSEFSLPGDALLVQQDSTVTGTTTGDSVVRFTLRVKNEGNAPVQIGARTTIDFKLAADDGPTYTPDGGAAATQPTRWTAPSYRTFALEDAAHTLRATWSAGAAVFGTTPPDILDMDVYGMSGPGLVPVVDPAAMNVDSDNEVRWIWGDDVTRARTVAPGDSVEFIIASALSSAAAPANTAPPAISGTPAESETLTATRGTWTNVSALTSYAYQWLRCDADGTACTPIAGADAAPYRVTGDDVGHAIRVRVAADGVSAESAATLVIAPDTVAPATPRITSAGMLGPARTKIVTWFEVDVADGTFECRVDSGSWVACTSPYTSGSLTEGEHLVEVRQVDAAGNASDPAGVRRVVDTTPPGLATISKRPAATTTDTSAEIAFSGEPGARWVCQIDGDFRPDCTSPLRLSGLALGAHVVKIIQIDSHSNGGDWLTIAWTVKAPEKPKPETPQEEPEFTATIGDEPAATGGGTPAGSTTVAVAKRGVDVGCQMTGVELESCRVKLYATTGAQAGAARRVLVGTGFVTADADTHELSVRVVLNRTGKALLRRSPAGLNVAVEITGTPVSGAAIRATGSARLVQKRTRVVIGGYDADEAKLTASARRTLRALAPGLGKGTRARIAGHTDNSARSASYLRKLGLRRAATVRAFLAARGARAAMRVVSYAARRPRATNATAAGRAANRRVVLTIVR